MPIKRPYRYKYANRSPERILCLNSVRLVCCESVVSNFLACCLPWRYGRIDASDDLEDEIFHVGSFKSVFERRQFIKDATQGPHVAFVVVWPILADFRRQVVGRPLDEENYKRIKCF